MAHGKGQEKLCIAFCSPLTMSLLGLVFSSTSAGWAESHIFVDIALPDHVSATLEITIENTLSSAGKLQVLWSRWQNNSEKLFSWIHCNHYPSSCLDIFR